MTSTDSAGSPPPVVLGGRYEIHRRIARGGMADVFLARDSALDRPVAVKVLFPEFATDPAFVERFRREAQAAANLSHPNIVGVYDWGAEAGTYYIVMEYVEGQSLAEVVRQAGPLNPQRAATMAFEVAGALGHAHQRGVVHRDIKPGNVLVSTSGTVKVTDFGIARALSSPSDELTQAGSVMGTATYFSPEQAQGFQVDARSDLYSLGVVLFEIVCGRPPFVGESPVAIAYKHVQELPPRPSQIVAGIPAGLEAIIGRLLAKAPDQRYLSADDLRADLRRYLDGAATLAEQAGQRTVANPTADAAATTAMPVQTAAPTTVAATVAAPVAQPAPAATPVAVGAEPDDAPSRTGMFVAAALVLLLALGGLGYWFVQSLSDTSGDQLTVPNVVDLQEADATKKLTDEGFNPVVTRQASTDAAVGVVFRQTPDANAKLEKGGDVTIFVSTGPDMVAVPKVNGLSEAEATAALKDAGFTVRSEQVEHDTIETGKVIESVPAQDTPAPKGGEIVLRVSKGKASVAIPDVKGKPVDAARKALTDAGFVVGDDQRQASADVAKDKVFGTSPAGEAAKGAPISLIISDGPQQVKVPAVKGQPEDAARSAIQAKGLEAEVKTKSVPVGDPNTGRVIEVDPAAGTLVDPGSTVTITVGVASAASTTTSPASTTTSP